MTMSTYNPISDTFAQVVTATSAAVTPLITPTPSAAQQSVLGNMDYRLTVQGTVAVWFAFGPPAPAAAPTAVIAVPGTPQRGLYIEPGISYTVSLPYGSQIAVIATGAGSNAYVTIGSGISF